MYWDTEADGARVEHWIRTEIAGSAVQCGQSLLKKLQPALLFQL